MFVVEFGDVFLLFEFDVCDCVVVEVVLVVFFVEFVVFDVLVNNVGFVFGVELVYKVSFDEWWMMIDMNCVGFVIVMYVLLFGMVECGCGYIFNIGLVVGLYFYVGGNVYGVIKVFVR